MGGIILLLSLLGCNNPGLSVSDRLSELNHTVSTEQDKVIEVQKIIVDALNKRDKDVIKQYLSPRALKTTDLDEGFDYVFSLFDGKIEDIEKKGCPVHETLSKSGNTKMLEGNFVLTTTDGKRLTLHFEFWIENEITQDREGVDLIKITEYREKPDNVVGISYSCAGVYNPSWDDDPDRIVDDP